MGFYFSAFMGKEPRVSVTIEVVAGKTEALNKPLRIVIDDPTLLSACREGWLSGPASYSVVPSPYGYFEMTIPKGQHILTCDISKMVSRDLNGWTLDTPSVSRGSSGDAVPPSDADWPCLVKGVYVDGFSSNATLSPRPNPAREPLTRVVWTARTQTNCPLVAWNGFSNEQGWTQDSHLLIPYPTEPSDQTKWASLSHTSLGIQEPSSIADANARLFLCGILATLAASALFEAVQSGVYLVSRPRTRPSANVGSPSNSAVSEPSGLSALGWVLAFALTLWGLIGSHRQQKK